MSLGQIRVPESKIDALCSILNFAKHYNQVRAKFFASIRGKIMSMSLAFGPVNRFMTSSLYSVMKCRQSWCKPPQVFQEAKAELRFWSSSLAVYNAQTI